MKRNLPQCDISLQRKLSKEEPASDMSAAWAHELDSHLWAKWSGFDRGVASSFSTLKLLTWNVWFSRFKQKERMISLLAESVVCLCADVLCLQEVTPVFHGAMLLSTFFQEHYSVCEDDSIGDYDVMIWVRKGIAVARHWIVPLTSRQGRRCLVVDLQLPSHVATDRNDDVNSLSSPVNLRVATVHLESSRGNHTTRAAQLDTVLSSLFSSSFPSPVCTFLVGDFNFCSSWQKENFVLESHPCVRDVWSHLKQGECGYTEDCAVNTMRNAEKRMHPGVRFDRVLQLFVTEATSSEDSTLPATDPCTPPRGLSLTTSALAAAPLPSAMDAVVPLDVALTGTQPFSDGVFPSDHFGVLCTLQVTSLCPTTD